MIMGLKQGELKIKPRMKLNHKIYIGNRLHFGELKNSAVKLVQ